MFDVRKGLNYFIILQKVKKEITIQNNVQTKVYVWKNAARQSRGINTLIVALFYYCGHGRGLDNNTCLGPVNMEVWGPVVPARLFQEKIRRADQKIMILIVTAQLINVFLDSKILFKKCCLNNQTKVHATVDVIKQATNSIQLSRT